jgi:hypothetical protein
MVRRRLTQNDARAIALALPEAEEGAHMGHADLRVRNKVFASLPKDPGTVAVKIAPPNLDALVRADPAAFTDVWGGRWLGVRLDKVTKAVLRDLLTDAWSLTAPKSLVTRFRKLVVLLALLSAPPVAAQSQPVQGPIVHTYAPSASTQREAARIRRICRWADTTAVLDADALLVVVRSSGPDPLAPSYDSFKWLRDEAHSLLNDSGSQFHIYLYAIRPNQRFQQTAHRSYDADPGGASGDPMTQISGNPYPGLVCPF